MTGKRNFHKELGLDTELLQKVKEQNSILQEYIENQRKEWSEKIKQLTSNLNSNNTETLVETEAYSLSYRHQASDELNQFLNKLAGLYSNKNEYIRDRLLFYQFNYKGKISSAGERKQHLEADSAQLTKRIQLMEAYCDYLRECKSECDRIGFIIKNKVQLMNITGM